MDAVKRVSLMIGEDQHRQLQEKGLNISGLVRDLITDYLSEHRVVISVSEETKTVYDKVISNSGAEDQDLEPFLQQALKQLLKKRIGELEELHRRLDDSKGG